jgi:hypothetical protein
MIGPGRNSNSDVFWLKIDRPVTSDGSRSGRELDAAEGAADGLAHRLGQHRLADAGHVLDQDVALAQQGHERHADLDVLPDDHALDAGDHALRGLLDVLHECSVSPVPVHGHRSRGPDPPQTIPQRVTDQFTRHRTGAGTRP